MSKDKLKKLLDKLMLLDFLRDLREIINSINAKLLYKIWKNKLRKVNEILSDEQSKKVLNSLVNMNSTFSNKLKYIDMMKEDTKLALNIDIHYLHKAFMLKCDIYQYFSPVYKLIPNEVFLDIGAFTGDTIISFVDKYKTFNKIYAFEPSYANFIECKKTIQKYSDDIQKKIVVYNVGLSNKEKVEKFNNNISYSGHGENDTVFCEVKNIHDVLPENEISEMTFVKLDVEGNEMDIFVSMQEDIRRNKPLIAVAVYHKLRDIWEIPLYLNELNTDYRFYLRHHTNWIFDTVLYAVPKERTY